MTSLRRFFGARQKVGATIAAIVLGVGVAVVAAPLSASAHTTSLDASASCSTDGATRTITYTGTTGAVPTGVTATLTVPSGTVTPTGSTITIAHDQVSTNGDYSFTQTVAGTVTSVSASAHLEWNDNNSADSSKTLTFANDCATPQPECTIVVWKIPGGDASHPFAEPQTIVSHTADACGDLTNYPPVPECGAYQIDNYTNGADLDNLITVGVLTAPQNPKEPLVASTTKQYAACLIDTAAVTITTTPPTCTIDGTIDFTSGLVHAHWADADNSDVTDGTRIADADSGYAFSNGDTQKAVSYTLPGTRLTGVECYPRDATASL